MIDYAHTTESLQNILEAVKTYTKGRVICVFGCGGDRDPVKRPIMGNIATTLSDYTILTSDNPRTEDPQKIMDDILSGVTTKDNYEVINDRALAIKKGISYITKDTVLLILGKGHEKYQEVNGEGYYVDREKEEMFASFTGFYLDPLDQQLYEDDGTIFEINVNGEIADLTETQHLTISGIDNYDILRAGIGVVTDIGYQSQTSTYSFETESNEIAQLKQNYLTAVANYNKKSADGTLTKEDYQHVKDSYAVFIDQLTAIVNKYKEENGVD